MHSRQQLVKDLYQFLHRYSERSRGFEHRAAFMQQTVSLLGNVSQHSDFRDRCRVIDSLRHCFVDLDIVEQLKLPLMIVDIPWHVMQQLKIEV